MDWAMSWHFDKTRGDYPVRIWFEGRYRHYGRYKTRDEAIRVSAREEAALGISHARTCLCGASLEGVRNRHRHRRFCDDCRKRGDKHLARLRAGKPPYSPIFPARDCELCGKVYIPIAENQKYCCLSHSKRAQWRRGRYRAKALLKAMRKLKEKYNVHV